MRPERSEKWSKFFGYLALIALMVLCSDLTTPSKTPFLRDAGKQKTITIERALSSLNGACEKDSSQARLAACHSAAQFLGRAALSNTAYNEPLPVWRDVSDDAFGPIVDRYNRDRQEILSSVSVGEWRIQAFGILAIAVMLGSLFLCIWLRPNDKYLDAPFLPKRHL
ncbi:MAG: hypothetical protein IOC64_05720 [Methylobacterium sp.]|nr:hypothetical protein [Methylobacterium sp.]MCA3605501.1 hypothetical protein [Methylobacterium sp.]MCA3607919.1 hypothetical protein [Methylobacterium sp.]MCA3613148.1 hypothetical protein [Methylobacterium sp.]MCA3617298.1 hypothetical protein [Methylobacterium sp.]